MTNQDVVKTLRILGNMLWSEGSFTREMSGALAKAICAVQREETILNDLEILKESFLSMDDRTFGNQETDKGHYVDGAYDFYTKVRDILEKDGYKSGDRAEYRPYTMIKEDE